MRLKAWLRGILLHRSDPLYSFQPALLTVIVSEERGPNEVAAQLARFRSLSPPETVTLGGVALRVWVPRYPAVGRSEWGPRLENRSGEPRRSERAPASARGSWALPDPFTYHV